MSVMSAVDPSYIASSMTLNETFWEVGRTELKTTAIDEPDISVSAAPLLPVVVATLIFKVEGTISVKPFRLIVKYGLYYLKFQIHLHSYAFVKYGSG